VGHIRLTGCYLPTPALVNSLNAQVVLFYSLNLPRDERTVKFFSASLILIRKIESYLILICKFFLNHQFDPVLIRPCETMYFFAS